MEGSALLRATEAAYSVAVKAWSTLFAYQFVVVAAPSR
jgi:hypothetical protein